MFHILKFTSRFHSGSRWKSRSQASEALEPWYDMHSWQVDNKSPDSWRTYLVYLTPWFSLNICYIIPWPSPQSAADLHTFHPFSIHFPSIFHPFSTHFPDQNGHFWTLPFPIFQWPLSHPPCRSTSLKFHTSEVSVAKNASPRGFAKNGGPPVCWPSFITIFWENQQKKYIYIN